MISKVWTMARNLVVASKVALAETVMNKYVRVQTNLNDHDHKTADSFVVGEDGILYLSRSNPPVTVAAYASGSWDFAEIRVSRADD
jgi:hypothetical protein